MNETVATLAEESEEHKSEMATYHTETETKLDDLQTSLQSVGTRVLLLLLPYLNDIEHDIKTELGQLVVSQSDEVKECINQTALELAVLQSSSHNALDYKLALAHNNITQESSTMIDLINTTLISVTTDLSCVKTDLSRVSDAVSDLSGDLEEHSLHASREIQSSLQSSTEHLTQLSVKMDTLQSTLDSVDTTMTEEFVSLDIQVGATISSELIPLETELDSLSTFIDDINTGLSEINDTTGKICDKLNNLPVYTCGGTGGWRRAVYLDMTNLNTDCPRGWSETNYSKRTCGRATDGLYTCDSVYFPVSGGEYSQVCGKIRAYQWGATLAFYGNYDGLSSINEAYFTGVAVMHGSPQQHIWTFAAGAAENDTSHLHVFCPCDASVNIPIPPFVGNNYFCESGYVYPGHFDLLYMFHSDDPLWDGDECISNSTCCSLNNPPYFTKTLATPTTDDLELRLCCYNPSVYEDVAVELIELYIK